MIMRKAFKARTKIALLAFFPLFLISCATTPKHLVYNENREYVALRQIKIKNGDGPYKHPYNIASGDMEEVLRNVYYRYMMLISYVWSKPVLAFMPRQQRLLATEISRALSEAGQDEQVAFSVVDKNNKHARTTGIIFIDDLGLNLILNCLHEADFTEAADNYDPEKSRWKFWPIDSSQSYRYMKEGKKAKQKNWLVIQLQKDDSSEEKASEE
jgi:hypothetical protein